MTPTEKANELVSAFYKNCSMAIAGATLIQWELSKNAAKMCCNEILSLHMINVMGRGHDEELNESEYWEQVMGEIEKIK